MAALKMWLFRKGQKQRLKPIKTETSRHSHQNTSLLLCPVTHSSKDLLAFTCLTSDSLPVSASTPLQLPLCCDPRPKFLPWKTRAMLLRQSHTFSHDAIQWMAATPLLQFAAQSQTSAQSRFVCSPYWAHGSLHSHTNSKGKGFGHPQSLPMGPGPPTLCFAGARWVSVGEARWVRALLHIFLSLPQQTLCLFCRWWADPFSRRVKEWHPELGL